MAPVVKNPHAKAGDKAWALDPWVERIPWRQRWQPTPIFLPGESHGQRSSAACSPWGCKRVRQDWATSRHTHTHSHTVYRLLLLLQLSRFRRVWLCATPQTAAHQAPLPWDSPGRNTGVGCHCLLQCMKVKSDSEVAHLCPTLCVRLLATPWTAAHQAPPSMGFQARALEWVPSPSLASFTTG